MAGDHRQSLPFPSDCLDLGLDQRRRSQVLQQVREGNNDGRTVEIRYHVPQDFVRD
jgi:hypothetical protein